MEHFPGFAFFFFGRLAHRTGVLARLEPGNVFFSSEQQEERSVKEV